ncbi:MAG: hypothetical protein A2297_00405 [Elusimicrobia bacterium RIFOXYB2_FULL_48_7]|nr:MAG: hypothetical protein A2297_00405 [Elusimicrobia bacterium RIFOXYB2_FULL_48_7]
MIRNCFVKGFKVLLLLLVVCLSNLYAQDALNREMISVQGRLTDSSGANKKDGDYSLTFKLFTVESGGASIWNETMPSVPCKNGIFNVYLGKSNQNKIDGHFKGQDNLWLEITIESGPDVFASETLLPRQQLVSVGYAMRAQNADTATEATHAAAANNADTVTNGV